MERHIKNSAQFSKIIQECQEEDQELQSYGIAVLLMSVPVDNEVDCIKCKLEADPTLPTRPYPTLPYPTHQTLPYPPDPTQ